VITVEELAAEVAALRRRVDVSESVLAIQAMKARYAELVDQRFSAGAIVDATTLADVVNSIASLFTPNGTWDAGPGLGACVGRRAIAQRLRETTFSITRHLFMNPRIDVDGQTAKATWDLLSPCRRAGGESFWMFGYEDDEYERIDGAWLHRSMKLTTLVLAPVGDGWVKIFR
jgi:hypothetical protein